MQKIGYRSTNSYSSRLAVSFKQYNRKATNFCGFFVSLFMEKFPNLDIESFPQNQ